MRSKPIRKTVRKKMLAANSCSQEVSHTFLPAERRRPIMPRIRGLSGKSGKGKLSEGIRLPQSAIESSVAGRVSTVCSEYRNSRVIGSCCELRMFLRSSQYVLPALDAASRNPGRFFRTRARRPLIRSERHFLIAGIGKIRSYVQGVLFSLSDSYSPGR